MGRTAKRSEGANVFLKRTAQFYRNQRRKAAKDGQCLAYTLAELRTIATGAVYHGRCRYCPAALTPENFGVDHALPLCRGGQHWLANLVFCCQACNQAKGALTMEEFQQLLIVVRFWEADGRTSVLSRLRAGGRMYSLRP